MSGRAVAPGSYNRPLDHASTDVASGAASVWGAVRALRVDRIGHATRAIEDPELVKHLAARRIPLELCPLSNVRTGVIGSVEAHPLRQYFDAGGVPVSLNTDDPLFFGDSLAMELESAQQVHRFTAMRSGASDCRRSRPRG